MWLTASIYMPRPLSTFDSVVKSRKIRSAGHVATIRETRNAYHLLVMKNTCNSFHVKNGGGNVSIILKWMSEKCDASMKIGGSSVSMDTKLPAGRPGFNSRQGQ
jgi:hypothetical protein